MSDIKHTIKFTHDDGKERRQSLYWCGRESQTKDEWAFQNAGHLALSVGGSVQPCKRCIKEIIKELEKEL